MNGRLYRSRDERVLAGVAGGLADYLDVDPSLVRVVWVILALFSGGAFLIVYIVMALVVPEEPWEGFAVPPSAPGAGAPPPTADQGAAAPAAETAAETAAPGIATAGGGAVPAAQPADAWRAQAHEWRAQRDAWRAQRRAERAARRARGETNGPTAGLIFGLILLAIGIVFLVPVLFPAFTIGRFWPLILVAIGIVLVIAALRPGRRPGP